MIWLTDACSTFYLVLADSSFLSSLESIVRGPNSHFTYLQALISYLFMVSHYGTSCTFLYPKLISFVHFFFLTNVLILLTSVNLFCLKCLRSSAVLLCGHTVLSPTLCNHQVLALQLERNFLKLICWCYHILKWNLGISIVLWARTVLPPLLRKLRTSLRWGCWSDCKYSYNARENSVAGHGKSWLTSFSSRRQSKGIRHCFCSPSTST